MKVTDAIIKRRTKRKYTNQRVSRDLLETLVELARFAPMGANLQPLKYAIIDGELSKKVFPLTKWSGYHPEDAPEDSEMPPCYIAILGDNEIKQNGQFETDAGTAGATICLAAEELGLSTCWLGAIKREEIKELLGLSEKYSLLYLIAVGYSEQKADYVDAKGDIKYFMNGDVLTVPKRTLDEILVEI
ncbi:MAG: nitroreductase family protein [Clostridia bacterium]|nr:nitroreductase family protein [Clostridia bacterium]